MRSFIVRKKFSFLYIFDIYYSLKLKSIIFQVYILIHNIILLFKY